MKSISIIVLAIVFLILTTLSVVIATRSPRKPRAVATPPAPTNMVGTFHSWLLGPSGTFTGQVQPPAIQFRSLNPRSSSARDSIEAAERHNLYEMQRYQQRALERMNSKTPLPLDSVSASLGEQIWDKPR